MAAACRAILPRHPACASSVPCPMPPHFYLEQISEPGTERAVPGMRAGNCLLVLTPHKTLHQHTSVFSSEKQEQSLPTTQRKEKVKIFWKAIFLKSLLAQGVAELLIGHAAWPSFCSDNFKPRALTNFSSFPRCWQQTCSLLFILDTNLHRVNLIPSPPLWIRELKVAYWNLFSFLLF